MDKDKFYELINVIKVWKVPVYERKIIPINSNDLSFVLSNLITDNIATRVSLSLDNDNYTLYVSTNIDHTDPLKLHIINIFKYMMTINNNFRHNKNDIKVENELELYLLGYISEKIVIQINKCCENTKNLIRNNIDISYNRGIIQDNDIVIIKNAISSNKHNICSLNAVSIRTLLKSLGRLECYKKVSVNSNEEICCEYLDSINSIMKNITQLISISKKFDNVQLLNNIDIHVISPQHRVVKYQSLIRFLSNGKYILNDKLLYKICDKLRIEPFEASNKNICMHTEMSLIETIYYKEKTNIDTRIRISSSSPSCLLCYQTVYLLKSFLRYNIDINNVSSSFDSEWVKPKISYEYNRVFLSSNIKNFNDLLLEYISTVLEDY
ncbi:hypothetical protein HDU92_007742 [Lobulomyces angularis]|nr:hypothetical protein HDU92_007742 [Lobulomyces angularis]